MADESGVNGQPDAAPSGSGLSRREVLRTAMLASLAAVGAPLIAACGTDSEQGAPAEPPPATGAEPASPSEPAEPAPAEPAPSGSPRPGEALAGLANTFITFNPALSPQLGSITVIRHVFEPLMQYDDQQQTWVPWLLTAAPERTAPNTFTASVRPDATFHDGSPLTGADVAWTFEYYKNPDTGSFFSTFLQTIETVEASGQDLTITVTEELPNLHFALSVPMIMPQAAFEAAGPDAFAAQPVGSGPYTFVSQTPGQRVELARFDGYTGPVTGSLTDIAFNYILEDASRIAQLTAGQLDLIDGVPYRDLESLQAGNLATDAVEGGRYVLIESNQFKKPFGDERVRQAMLYGIDRDTLIEAVFPGGNALIADSQLPPSHPYYQEPQTVYRYDPDRAKALLADAGYGDGFDYEMLLSTIPWITQLGTLMKAQLDEIGMRGSIRLTETEAGYGIVATKEYDIYVAYGNWYALGRFADVPYRAFNYGAGRDGFYGKVEGRDDEYDRLVDAAFAGATEEAQIAGYLAAQELFSKSVPNNYTILWAKITGAWQPYVQGYAPPPDDLPILTSVTT
jgi:peptide/nickel transport system substrate-binding protein